MIQQRPNVLLVLFDSLGAEDLSEHADHLPVLSGLFKSGIVFSNTYVCAPEAGPSRASLFTGLDMAAHGVWTDGVALPDRETTLPEVFWRNGYDTWLVGRRHLAGVSHWTTETPRRQEYHHYDWSHGPLHRSRQNAYLAWLQSRTPDLYAQIFPSQANPDDTRIPSWQRDAMAQIPDDISHNMWVGTQCQIRLANKPPNPFFGIAGFVVGSSQGARSTDTACFDSLNLRALKQADAALGSILRDVPKNTIVVVTAGRGTVDAFGSTAPDKALRVPLLIKTPLGPAGIQTETVSTMDVAATLYEATNIVSPQRQQGMCLLTNKRRGWALSRLRHPDLPQQTILNTDRWKLILNHDPMTYRLYDKYQDVTETVDLAQDTSHGRHLDDMIDFMIDARVALEDRTEPRVAKF